MNSDQNTNTLSSDEIERMNSVTMAVHQLFFDMFGAYGSSWLSKWETGRLYEDAKDIGVISAKKLWSNELYEAGIDPKTIAEATRRCYRENDRAPNLAFFLEICKSIMPRKTSLQKDSIDWGSTTEKSVVIVEYERRGDGVDWARQIMAKDAAGYHVSLYAKKTAANVLINRM